MFFRMVRSTELSKQLGEDMNYTTEDILNQIAIARSRLDNDNPRELVLAQPQTLLEDSREVYKDKKIERKKHISREDEETANGEVSSETYLLGDSPSDVGIPSLSSLDQTAFDSNTSPPASTSSRELTFTGISVQHVRTRNGVKLCLTLQTYEDSLIGEVVELTGELKRHSRLRELKHYDADDDWFATDVYQYLIDELKGFSPEEGKNICIGRLHDRGKRGAWYANMVVVGTMDDNQCLQTVYFYSDDEQYQIELIGELSDRQRELYHSTGIYGNLVSNRKAPRLATAPRKSFNP